MADPIPLYYTFGNHQHWVDMEWLWGYHVLPNSIRDMLKLCQEAGVKGCVNFDGIGYEKLASEDPEAFADLRQAVQEGTFEIVGGSYGQPYGLFHGGESNVRQRIFGARASKRLFGVPVQTFWEEEFDFFPQLPQILRGVGIEYASLFFQWTWHTPEVPREDVPVVWWEGQDGSRLLCATRNKLNLHQWPEDMDIVLAELAESPPSTDGPTPLVLQWLELMPSPDWMCRSELILPKLRQLMSDKRFDVRPVTLGGYLRGMTGGMTVPVMVSSTVSVENEEVHRRKGAYLPHWTAKGATYAVTFRLADALPKEVQAQYGAERQRLKELRDHGLLKSDALGFEYQRLFSDKVEQALDAGLGSCLLNDPESAEIVASAVRHFDGDRYRLHAWCVMPNHVHAVLEPLGDNELAKIMHSWKSFTSHAINKLLGRQGDVWQDEYYDHLVRGAADYDRQVGYVMENPAIAGLKAWNWTWSVQPLGHHDRDVSATSAKSALPAEESQADHDRDGHGNHDRDDRATFPVRRYTMDQVWHGMTLGKNGDNIRRLSRQAEASLLSAETLAAVAGLFGRPYAQWDVYPTWELEEAWRELLSAQHHDIDECEGLCGYVGRFSYERSLALSSRIRRASLRRIVERAGGRRPPEVYGGFQHALGLRDSEVDGTPTYRMSDSMKAPERLLYFNALGWSVKFTFPRSGASRLPTQSFEIPAFGYAIIERGQAVVKEADESKKEPILKARPIESEFAHGDILGRKDLVRGGFQSLVSAEFPEGALLEGSFSCVVGRNGTVVPVEVERREFDPTTERYKTIPGTLGELSCRVAKCHAFRAIDIEYRGAIDRPDPGLGGSLRLVIKPAFQARLIVDQPLGVSEVAPTAKGLKKYPTGDWMTSPQWFEEVHRPFSAWSFVDLVDAGNPDRGLLIVHDGSQQWMLQDDGSLHCVLSAYDPWDEDYFVDTVSSQFKLIPHGPMTHSQRWKLAREAFQEPFMARFDGAIEGVASFSPLVCDASNVVCTAFYRETRDSAKGQDFHAADVLGVDYPYALRMVELDGMETEALLTFGATVARALKTNLLGEPDIDLAVTDGSEVQIQLKPFEIATVYLDLVEGRKQVRDLDAKREIWATVHRVD